METANRERKNSTTIFSLDQSARLVNQLMGTVPDSAGPCSGTPLPKGKEDVLSQLLIQQYLNELSRLKKISGTHRESVVREAVPPRLEMERAFCR